MESTRDPLTCSQETRAVLMSGLAEAIQVSLSETIDPPLGQSHLGEPPSRTDRAKSRLISPTVPSNGT